MEEYSENEIRIKRSIFWKIYFVLLICLIVWGTNESLIDENSGLIEIIEIPMVLIATIGLFGYVFSKRIYKQSFWFTFFWVYLIFSLVSPFLSEIEFSTPDDPELSAAENKFINTFSMILAFVLIIPLILPSYIGLLLYALPSNKLWEKIER
jgi:hypothetical protein|tara:strand:+ start:206 stop:661 length:456 start_codon:yes stop_codon:yes gene_type:complete